MPARPGQILWDVAIEEVTSRTDSTRVSKESTILIIGAKNCGKSSILPQNLNQDSVPKPTVALDYSYAHVGPANKIVKDVGHYWELGGGIWLSQLMEIAIRPETIESLTVVVMVDLSVPSEIWITIKSLLDSAKSCIISVVNQMKQQNPKILEVLKKSAWERIGKDHEDRDTLEPFLVPLIIIGGKYDKFQNFDPEQKKIICKTLRFLAHYYGATLQFFSIKEKSLGKRVEALKNYHLFGIPLPKLHQVEHNKPVSIPVGMDSLKLIGNLKVDEREIKSLQNKCPIERWEYAFTKYFPQEKSANPQMSIDPSRDSQFKEAAIDVLKAQKDEELQKQIQQASRSAGRAVVNQH